MKPFTADYEANVMGSISADAQMTLAAAGGDRWNYVLSVKSPVATLRQATVFEDRNGSWRPLSGNDFTQMVFKKSQTNASYDWAKGEARWSGDVKADRAGPVKLQDGDLDGMLLNLAIVRDVAAGKPLNYRLVDNGVVRAQTYQNLGKDTVTVAGKPRNATKVSRSSENKQVIVWVVDGQTGQVIKKVAAGGFDVLFMAPASIAVVAGAGAVHAVDYTSHEKLAPLVTSSNAAFSQAALSPDAKLAVIHGPGGVAIVNATSGKAVGTMLPFTRVVDVTIDWGR